MSNYAIAGNPVASHSEALPQPVPQIESLMCEQVIHLDRLSDMIERAARAFGPVLHPELCGDGKMNAEPQPCRSPLGAQLHNHNEMLERSLVALDALIRRAAV